MQTEQEQQPKQVTAKELNTNKMKDSPVDTCNASCEPSYSYPDARGLIHKKQQEHHNMAHNYEILFGLLPLKLTREQNIAITAILERK